MLHNLYNNKITLIVFWLSDNLFYTPVQSQDLEPGLLSAMPIGGNFAIVSYGYSSGNILLVYQFMWFDKK